MARKKWQIAQYDKEAAAQLAESCDLDPFASLILYSRGIRTAREAESFFTESAELIDPFLIKDMDLAVPRIEKAIENFERIAIYGDYDADGVTATALLYTYLTTQEANVAYYLPDREKDGYGLNKEAVKRLYDDGTNLIITVDNGISAIEAADYAAELGIDLIVTDHHQVGDTLPKAVAVIDPHRADCACPYKDWAGVGVAFKLITALEGSFGDELIEDYGDLIAIGTVADVVPLLGENRLLVKYGLQVMQNSQRPGISALLETAGVHDKPLTSTRLAFSICPRINAAGRMKNARTAVHLLLEEDREVAGELARELDVMNQDRQSTEHEILTQAEQQIAQNKTRRYDRVLVVAGENWHPGVIGIVAAKLLERYGRPTLVLSINGDTAKGSGRSIDGFSLYESLSACSDTLVGFGGHKLAAGFTVETSRIDEFRKAINNYAASLDEMPYHTLDLDCRLNPAYINEALLDTLERLEPFGACNPQPTFCLANMEITQIKPIGGGKHLRLLLSRRGTTIQAVKFGTSAIDFPYREGDTVDLAVRLDKNEYRGTVSVSVMVVDVRLSGQNEDALLSTERLYEKYARGEVLTPEEADICLPPREMMAETFRYVRSFGGWRRDIYALCCRLKTAEGNMCRTQIALNAMCELGIITFEDDGTYKLPQQQQKVNLDNSTILRSLKEIKEAAV